jgi:hypothetical protein
LRSGCSLCAVSSLIPLVAWNALISRCSGHTLGSLTACYALRSLKTLRTDVSL